MMLKMFVKVKSTETYSVYTCNPRGGIWWCQGKGRSRTAGGLQTVGNLCGFDTQTAASAKQNKNSILMIFELGLQISVSINKSILDEHFHKACETNPKDL